MFKIAFGTYLGIYLAWLLFILVPYLTGGWKPADAQTACVRHRGVHQIVDTSSSLTNLEHGHKIVVVCTDGVVVGVK